MMAGYRSRVAGALTVVVTIATCAASCSSTQERPPTMNLTSAQMAPAAAGSCKIDAVKMCQATGATPSTAPQPAIASSYGPPNMPDSIEFQIPAGETIKLMCYYDPQHTSVYRADATPQSPLSGNSVEYMKKQGFCVNN
jgi:hypothetical protein